MVEPVRERPARPVQERSRDTQTRILDAAITALVIHGYSGATTLRIQEIAGVSRGRLLHHFPSRDDLLVASVSHITEARMLDLAQDEQWPDEPAARIDVVIDRMWETFHQDYFWASTELWMAARSNARLKDALESHEHRLDGFIIDKVGILFGEATVRVGSYAMVRDLIIASMRGVALTYAYRPRDPLMDPHLSQWKTVTRRILLGSAPPGTSL